MKIPKMSTKNSGNSIENNFGEERMPLRHKKVGRSEVHCGCWALQQTYVSAAMHTLHHLYCQSCINDLNQKVFRLVYVSSIKIVYHTGSVTCI